MIEAQPPNKYEQLVDRLAIPALSARSKAEQMKVIDAATESANVKNRAGLNAPTLLWAIGSTSITFLGLIQIQFFHSKWIFILAVPLLVAEFVGSLYWGYWRWRRACRAEFDRSIRNQLGDRTDSAASKIST